MSKQSAKKVIDRIMNYPHKEKGCSYICGPHLEPCVMVRAHDGDCECRECHQKQCSHPMAARKGLSPVDRSEKCRLCGLIMTDPMLEMDAGAGQSDYPMALIFTSSKFIVTAFGYDREHCEDVLQCVLHGRFGDHEGDREWRKI